MREILTDRDFLDWYEYYKFRPFGHWIDNEMRAKQTAAWTGKFEMPSIEPEKELSEEEQIAALPGIGGAEEFLKSLAKKDD